MSKRRVRLLGGLLGGMFLLVLSLYLVPPLVLVDAEADASNRSMIESARHWVIAARDGSWLPIHVRYVGGRCWLRLRAFYFEEWTPPYLRPRYAVAVTSIGPWTPDDPDWGGWYALDSIQQVESRLIAESGEGEACY